MSRIAWERQRRATTKRVSYNETDMWTQSLKQGSSDSSSDTPPAKRRNQTRNSRSKKKEESYSSESEEEDEYSSSSEEERPLPSKRIPKQRRFSSDDEKPKKKPKPKPKKKPVVESSYDDEYDEEYEYEDVVQAILGMKDEFEEDDRTDTAGEEDDEKKEKLYYVKFAGKSYIHCKYMKQEEIEELEGGDAALSRFNKRMSNQILGHSLSIPNLLTVDEVGINSDWYEIDRILDDANDHGRQEYLVKWKSMEYSEATWEGEDDVKDKSKIEAYFQRLEHSNPTKIPARWKHPGKDAYHPIETPPKSNSGQDELRDYQLEGLNWLRFCWYMRRNNILADEMGLGKTAQMVSMLNALAVEQNITGPFLVVAPLSTLPQWKMEIERWTHLNCVIFHGNKESREMIINTEFHVLDDKGRLRDNRVQFDVVITNYDIFRTEFKALSAIQWRYLVADEGHKLKNYKGKIYGLMEQLEFEHCTLLTGTPIQNNLVELWSLLHFLHPDKFDDVDEFMTKYDMTDRDQVKEIQKVMESYMLRRKKGDVEKAILPKEETIISVELTRIQKTFYRAFLHENAGTLLKQITGASSISLQNLMMQLRKVCNHPFLIYGAEDGIVKDMAGDAKYEGKTRREIRKRAVVDSSGKMILIDKLLPKLREDGHKVLIFSQMVRILDIIEDYLHIRGYTYERLDGGSSENERQAAIDRFKKEDRFVFLLSTKAGGIGINLTAADTVIIYDSDWNPQNDIQAQARCHRIGQTQTVKVYRLITRGTYESEMFDRASKKLGLDHVVLDGGEMSKNEMKPDEIEHMLRNGAYGLFNDDDSELDQFCAADIDQILKHRATLYHEDVVSGGGSVFAKATFKAEDEDLDMNSKDFWQQVLPKARSTDNLGDSLIRKCRQESTMKTQKDTTDPRKIMKDLVDRGFKGGASESRIVTIAISLYRPDDKAAVVAIHQVLRGNRPMLEDGEEEEEDEKIEVDDPVKVFGELTFTVEPRAKKIVERVAFFARLDRALYFVQRESITWPLLQPVWEDPAAEYSLMMGIHRYGLADLMQSIDDPELGLKDTQPLTAGVIEKRVFNLIEEIEKQFDPRKVRPPNNFEPMAPAKWKELHPQLLARTELGDHELLSLVQAMSFLGVPLRGDGEYDWGKLKEVANLSCVTTETVRKAGTKIYEMVQSLDEDKKGEEKKADEDDKEEKEEDKAKDERDEEKGDEEVIHIDVERFPELASLEENMKPRDIKKLKTTLSEMETIYDFIANNNPRKWELVKEAPKNEHLPAWWGYEEDRGLIMALAEYGILLVCSWMVDPDLPFRQKIPAEYLEQIEKMAAQEKKRQKGIKPPKELEEFSYITKERPRVFRALAVIEFVNKSLKRKTKHSRPKKSQSEYLFKMRGLRVISYGTPRAEPEFRHREIFYPVGYCVERGYKPKSQGPEGAMVFYKCEITEQDGHPVFTITSMQDPEKKYEDTTLVGAWKQLQEALGCEVHPRRQTKNSHHFFGLLQPEVREKLDEMTKDIPPLATSEPKPKSTKSKAKSLTSQIVPFTLKIQEMPWVVTPRKKREPQSPKVSISIAPAVQNTMTPVVLQNVLPSPPAPVPIPVVPVQVQPPAQPEPQNE